LLLQGRRQPAELLWMERHTIRTRQEGNGNLPYRSGLPIRTFRSLPKHKRGSGPFGDPMYLGHIGNHGGDFTTVSAFKTEGLRIYDF
jgi:hypothetical protein